MFPIAYLALIRPKQESLTSHLGDLIGSTIWVGTDLTPDNAIGNDGDYYVVKNASLGNRWGAHDWRKESGIWVHVREVTSVPTYDNVSALRNTEIPAGYAAYGSPAVPRLIVTIGQDTPLDGKGAFWTWDGGSVADDTGASDSSVIRPTNIAALDPGRWLRTLVNDIENTPQPQIPGSAKAWVTFDGTKTNSDISPAADSDATANTLTSTAFSAWTNGQLCWMRASNGPLAGIETYIPYYVRKIGANVIRLYTNKTDAVAGTGTPVDITVTDTANVILTFWNAEPILTAFNIDGVITDDDTSTNLTNFYVDFTTEPDNANYIINVMPLAVSDDDQKYGVNGFVSIGSVPRTGPIQAGFDIFSIDSVTGPTASTRICVTVFNTN